MSKVNRDSMWISCPLAVKSFICYIYSMTEAYSKASKARRMKLTPEERSAHAKMMADARWGKVSKKKRVEFVKKILLPAQGRFKDQK